MDAFMYIFDKSSEDETNRFWRCRHKDLFCQAQIHTGKLDFKVLTFFTKNHSRDSEGDE